MTTKIGYLHVVQALHGDAFMLEHNDGFMLIDGGPGQSYVDNTIRHTTFNLLQLLIHLSEKNRVHNNKAINHKLEAIDTVVLTHDDEDHKNGIADLFRYLIGTNNAPAPAIDWKVGKAAMHTPATPPIKSIWYNSQAKLEEQYYRYERRIPYDRTYDPGWFDLLLAGYNGILNSNNEICFNADFKPQPEHFVTLVCNGSVSARTDMTLRKGQFLFNILGPSYDKELMKDGLAFIEVLKRTSERERDRVVHTDARLSGKRGGTGFQSLGQSPTSDYSPKNRSSVAFNAVDKDDPATRVLMLGDAALASEVNAGKYNIMKIAHHGSGHNNYLSSREWTMNHEVKIKVSESVLKQSFAFFYKMIAKKYVISASPDTGSPNPHIATILGIFFAVLERRLKNPKSTEVVDIYLTNELPLITKTTIEAFLTDPEGAKYPNPDGGLDVHVLAKGNDNATLTLLHSFSGYVRLFLLKPNLAYGTIGIYDDDPDLAYWKEYADKDFHKPKVTAASSATSVSNKKRNLTSPLPGGASTSKRKPGS